MPQNDTLRFHYTEKPINDLYGIVIICCADYKMHIKHYGIEMQVYLKLSKVTEYGGLSTGLYQVKVNILCFILICRHIYHLTAFY